MMYRINGVKGEQFVEADTPKQAAEAAGYMVGDSTPRHKRRICVVVSQGINTTYFNMIGIKDNSSIELQ